MGKETDRLEKTESPTPQTEAQIERSQAPMKKRFKEQGSKLVVSAEVSKDIWDALEKRVESGEFDSRSDLVRTALSRFLQP